MNQISFFLGKFFIALYFLIAGINNARNFKGLCHFVHAKKLPMPQVVMGLVIALEIMGSFAIIFHIAQKIFIVLFILFTIACLYKFCDFWHKTGKERQLTFVIFCANVAVIGGLLIILSV